MSPENKDSIAPLGVPDPSKITPLNENKELTPAEKRMFRLLQDFQQMLHVGKRKGHTSKHKHMSASPNKYWEHKKNLDRKISNSIINKLYNVAKENGALGGKICGAGGGGHLLVYSELENRYKIIEKMSNLGCRLVTFGFDNDGLQTWEVYEHGVRA